MTPWTTPNLVSLVAKAKFSVYGYQKEKYKIIDIEKLLLKICDKRYFFKSHFVNKIIILICFLRDGFFFLVVLPVKLGRLREA